MGVAVGGAAVGGMDVAVGSAAVGGMGVAVGGAAVGGMGVAVGGTAVGGMGVAVGAAAFGAGVSLVTLAAGRKSVVAGDVVGDEIDVGSTATARVAVAENVTAGAAAAGAGVEAGASALGASVGLAASAGWATAVPVVPVASCESAFLGASAAGAAGAAAGAAARCAGEAHAASTHTAMTNAIRRNARINCFMVVPVLVPVGLGRPSAPDATGSSPLDPRTGQRRTPAARSRSTPIRSRYHPTPFSPVSTYNGYSIIATQIALVLVFVVVLVLVYVLVHSPVRQITFMTTPTSSWEEYPDTYREREVQTVLSAVQAGESASLVGLSGAGKSNVLGFLANRVVRLGQRFALVDCNRLSERNNHALFRLMRRAISSPEEFVALSALGDEFEALDMAINAALSSTPKLTFLLDRFDDLIFPSSQVTQTGEAGQNLRALFNNLRALRDGHKFKLTFVTATRRPLTDYTELAELFYAHTIWLGPLSTSDARWNVTRYAKRKGLAWDDTIAETLITASRGYPSLLRAACEAYAAGARLDLKSLSEHSATVARVKEFWADQPNDTEIAASGLSDNPMLFAQQPKRTPTFDTTKLTAKEKLLLDYLIANPDRVCDKDEVIRAVWPEDKIIEKGIRDDSIAQLIRRLREKIEPDPAAPKYILTVPGRGYRFVI